MKTALLLLAFLGQAGTAPPDVPLADPTPDFPLHVHLISARFGADTVREYRSLQGEMRGGPGYLQATGSYHGFGAGNLLGDTPRGFDYAFDCGAAFVENRQAQDFYQARWKKQDERLEILMQRIGSDHYDICELKLAMKPHPFSDGEASTLRNNSRVPSTALWEDPEVAFTDPDPDYPVHLHVLTTYRRYGTGRTEGYGSANILGDNPQGLDYSYSCAHGFLANTQADESFQGPWVKPGQRLEILLQRIGSDRVDRCELKVTVKIAPYPAPHIVADTPAGQPVLVRP